MHRREFVALASAAALGAQMKPAAAQSDSLPPLLKPMDLGLRIAPSDSPEERLRRVRDLGFSNCVLSLDGYVGHFTDELAAQFRDLLQKYQLVVTAVEVVSPPPLVWDFQHGPSTIGLVPPATRAARIDALRQVSDFAVRFDIGQVQTHCGFIPEDPANPLYEQTVGAIRTVAQHCLGNGQYFLMETGQETPTTMARMLRDVGMNNLGVGLDTADLILCGKANPVDAVDILGSRVRSIHARDGRWPTDPDKLGEEVLIGTGLVDFRQVLTKLRRLGYSGTVTIGRETSGAQQLKDVRAEKAYLEAILHDVLA